MSRELTEYDVSWSNKCTLLVCVVDYIFTRDDCESFDVLLRMIQFVRDR